MTSYTETTSLYPSQRLSIYHPSRCPSQNRSLCQPLSLSISLSLSLSFSLSFSLSLSLSFSQKQNNMRPLRPEIHTTSHSCLLVLLVRFHGKPRRRLTPLKYQQFSPQDHNATGIAVKNNNTGDPPPPVPVAAPGVTNTGSTECSG